MLGVNYGGRPERGDILLDNYFFQLADAKDPKTPVEELEKLANSDFYNVRYWVTQNLNVTVEILEKLSEENNYHVVYGVATSPNVTDEILRKLAQNKESIIRRKAAENPNASEITKRLYLMTVTKLS
jgi:predicted transcriptional regulator